MSEYKRPISLMDFEIAVHDLPDQELGSILENLHVSISRLIQSNELMQSLMDKEKKKIEKTHIAEGEVAGEEKEDDGDDNDDEFDTPTKDDIKIYLDSISENGVVIENQQARCRIIENELELRNLPSSRPQDTQHRSSQNSNDVQISTDNEQIAL